MNNAEIITICRQSCQRVALFSIGLLFMCRSLPAIGQDESQNEPSPPTAAQWVWQNPRPQGNNLYGVSFVEGGTAFAVGDYGAVVRRNDGSHKWIVLSSGTTSALYAVSFVDADIGTAVGGDGTIIRTSDGGNTWSSQTSGTSNPLFGVSFIDADHGTAVGDSGTIVRTTDGGANWATQTSGTTNALNGVSFTDSNNGTAVSW